MVSGKIAVLVIDVDDDLGTKAKIKGPIIGRKNNLEAAMSLSLSDPEDPDSNTIFKAINIYDKLKKQGKEAEIITLTGDSKLGIKASSKIAKQLDNILKENSLHRAIIVTDGSSDEEVLPIIQSRIKVDGVERVVIKQAKELERTYFVLLEKLKDPNYRKILIGIPAIILILISAVYAFNIKIQYVGVLVGTILLLKGFSLDEKLEEIIQSFKIESSNTLAVILYILVMVLLFISLYTSYQAFIDGITIGLAGISLYAYIFDTFITPAFFVFLLAMIMKIIDLYSVGKGRITLINQLQLTISLILGFIVLKATTTWIVNLSPPYVYFSDLIMIILGVLVFEYISSLYFKNIKSDIIATLDLKGKEVYDVQGNFYGKITSIDLKRGILRISSPFGRYLSIKLSKVRDIQDSVIIE